MTQYNCTQVQSLVQSTTRMTSSQFTQSQWIHYILIGSYLMNGHMLIQQHYLLYNTTHSIILQ